MSYCDLPCGCVVGQSRCDKAKALCDEFDRLWYDASLHHNDMGLLLRLTAAKNQLKEHYEAVPLAKAA